LASDGGRRGSRGRLVGFGLIFLVGLIVQLHATREGSSGERSGELGSGGRGSSRGGKDSRRRDDREMGLCAGTTMGRRRGGGGRVQL
jgi:hypothetical protein